MKRVFWGLGLIVSIWSASAVAKAVEGDVKEDRSGRIEGSDVALTDWVTGCRQFNTRAYCDCLAKGFVCTGAQASINDRHRAIISLIDKLQVQGVKAAGREVFELLGNDDSSAVAETLTKRYNLSANDVKQIMRSYSDVRVQQTADRSGRRAVPEALKADAQAVN